jgi:FkbM family methyltransferase
MVLLMLSDSSAKLTDTTSEETVAWKVDWANRTIMVPQGIRFRLDSLDSQIFAETFLYELHRLDLEPGSCVVDVGGFVGDTALYYAHQGASVYVYEPNPVVFRKLEQNLELNPALKTRIKTYNKAVGKPGTPVFHFSASALGAGSLYKLNYHEIAVGVESVTLSDVLAENRLNSCDLLKADCKGSELELVKDQAISRFKRLQIEYSLENQASTLTDLLADLKAKGFRDFHIFKHNCNRFDLNVYGMLTATRRS